MSIDWLPIFYSALASGLLSMVISHVYYRISLSSTEQLHLAQMQAAEERHAAQMGQMEKHHAEQVLVLRTTLLAIEKDTGVEAARDQQGHLTGGVHHDGQYTAAPDVAREAIEATTKAVGSSSK